MLELKSISIDVGSKPVVKSLSLVIRPGSIHALMGPNGSGKSSLSLTLSGHPAYQLSPDSIITLDNQDVTRLAPEAKAQQGLFLSFQNPVAIPGLTVKQLAKIINDHLRPEKLPVIDLLDKIEEYRRFLDIKPELLDRGVNENFSGGEKKRIEMLQLLLAEPKYALIDEVDSGLDIDAVKTVAAAIKYASTNFQTGCLVITHYRRILDHLQPDQVHVLAHGTLVNSGHQELVDQVEKAGYAQFT